MVMRYGLRDRKKNKREKEIQKGNERFIEKR